MLWLLACLYSLLLTPLVHTVTVRAPDACVNAQSIHAESFALFVFPCDVSQPVPACNTWVSLALAACVEGWFQTFMDRQPNCELWQLSHRNEQVYGREIDTEEAPGRYADHDLF